MLYRDLNSAGKASRVEKTKRVHGGNVRKKLSVEMDKVS